MPSCKDKKKAIPSVFEGIASTTRHNQLHGTITKLAQRTMIRVAHNDVIQHFDLEKLARADEVAGHFDVGFRRLRLTGRVVGRQAGSSRSRSQQNLWPWRKRR